MNNQNLSLQNSASPALHSPGSSFFSSLWVVIIGATLCNFLWGSATPCIKVGYRMLSIAADDTSSVVLFAGIRFFFAGLMTVIACSLIQKKVLVPETTSAAGKVIVISLFQTILQYFFFYGGLTKATGTKSAIILATNVFASLLIAALLFNQEKLTPRKITGCIIGFSGVILVNLFGFKGDFGGFAWNGEGFIFMASVCYGVSGCFVKKYSQTENTVMLSGWQFVFGGAVMAVTGFASGGRITGWSGTSIGLLGYLCFISAFSYTLWGLLLKHNDVSRVVIFGFSNPVFGVILSSWLLDEKGQTGFVTIISLILVCLGIFTVNYQKKNKVSNQGNPA